MQGKNWKTKHSNTIHLYILCVVLPRNIPCFCSLLLLSFSLHLSPVNVSRLHFYCSRSAIYSRANWITMRFSSKPPPLIFLALKPLSKPCVCIRHKRTTTTTKNHAQYWLPNNGNIFTSSFEISRWGIIVLKYLPSN